MIVGAMIVGAMIVGAMIVGAMRRHQWRYSKHVYIKRIPNIQNVTRDRPM